MTESKPCETDQSKSIQIKNWMPQMKFSILGIQSTSCVVQLLFNPKLTPSNGISMFFATNESAGTPREDGNDHVLSPILFLKQTYMANLQHALSFQLGRRQKSHRPCPQTAEGSFQHSPPVCWGLSTEQANGPPRETSGNKTWTRCLRICYWFEDIQLNLSSFLSNRSPLFTCTLLIIKNTLIKFFLEIKVHAESWGLS